MQKSYFVYAQATRHAAFALNRTLARRGTRLWADFEQMDRETDRERRKAFNETDEVVVLLSGALNDYPLNDFDNTLMLQLFEGSHKDKSWHLYWLGTGSLAPELECCFDSKTVIDPLCWTSLKTHLSTNTFQREELKVDDTTIDASIKRMFAPDELDIYSDRKAGKLHLFFQKDIDWSIIEAVFDCQSKRVTLKYPQDQSDLGVQIRHLLWPDFLEANNLLIVQTANGKAIKAIQVPLHAISRETIDYITENDSRRAFDRYYPDSNELVSFVKGFFS